MIGQVSIRYAYRSLFRHTRRSLLSVFGVGVGCAIGLIANAFYSGSAEMQIRAVSESGGGHLRVVPREWIESRRNSLRLADPDAAIKSAGALPGVRHAVPRSRTSGLLAFGNRTTGVEIVGVDPDREQASNRIVNQSELQGRYLKPGDDGFVVIGKTLAERLDVELDDDLLVTLSGQGEIQSGMLRIVGILATGNRDLDAAICHVTGSHLASLSGYAEIGEISILLEDYKRIEQLREELSRAFTNGNAVITWREVNPSIAGNVDGDTAFIRLLSFIIMVVVMLGVASAQLTSFLERRHEFGVLTALGMKGSQIIMLVILEALMIGLGGAIAALSIGGPAAYLLATKGVNFAALMGDLSIGNVLFDPHIYGSFGPWLIAYAFTVCLFSTAVASLYPAWFAMHINPASELRPA
jgi:ABC-type lipoprotein release transport system permease subunit